MRNRHKIAFRNATPAAADERNHLVALRKRALARRDEYCDLFARFHHHPELRAVSLWLTPGDGVALGVEWPPEVAAPEGWRRDAKQPQCIVPALTTRAGKKVREELKRLAFPSPRPALARLGVPDPVFVPTVLTTTPGSDGWFLHATVTINDPLALWVAYPTRDVVDARELTDMSTYGWEQREAAEFEAVWRR